MSRKKIQVESRRVTTKYTKAPAKRLKSKR